MVVSVEVPITGINGNGRVTVVDQAVFDKYDLGNKKVFMSGDYAAVTFEGAQWLLHRLLMRDQLEVNPGKEIDHINRNKLDNRLENLRVATHGQNMQNRKRRAGPLSDYMGVYWDTILCMWRASKNVKARSITIGYFQDKEIAAYAFDQVSRIVPQQKLEFNFPSQRVRPVPDFVMKYVQSVIDGPRYKQLIARNLYEYSTGGFCAHFQGKSSHKVCTREEAVEILAQMKIGEYIPPAKETESDEETETKPVSAPVPVPDSAWKDGKKPQRLFMAESGLLTDDMDNFYAFVGGVLSPVINL